MIDFDTPIESLDLPDHLDRDRVEIYQNNSRDGKPYVAVAYEKRELHDGTTWYHEPPNHTITSEYRNAVAQLSSIDLSKIELDRDIPTTTLSHE